MKKNKDIISLIRHTGAIRKFKDIPLRHSLITKIVNAGIWAPSVLAFQPWEYVLISDKKLIKNIALVCRENAFRFPPVAEKILLLTSNVIQGSNFLIAVYNNQKLSNQIKRHGLKWVKYLNNAELLSIGASIQNMYLVSSYLGLGAVWLDSPCLLQERINHLLRTNFELTALLAIGYPDMKAKRARRNKSIANLTFLK